MQRRVLELAPKNKFALRKLVRDCRALGRLQEALQYQKEVFRLATTQEEYDAEQEILADIQFELVHEEYQTKNSTDSYRNALRTLISEHRHYAPALATLAELEAENGATQRASEHWHKAYNASNDVVHLDNACGAWIAKEQPQKAIELVRKAIAQTTKEKKDASHAQMLLVKLLLHLENTTDAEKELGILEKNGVPEILEKDLTLLKAYLLRKRGQLEQAYDHVLSLVGPQQEITTTKLISSVST